MTTIHTPARRRIESLIKKHGTQHAVSILKDSTLAKGTLFCSLQNYPYGIAIDDREGNTYRVGLCKSFALTHRFDDLTKAELAKAESTEIR